MWEMRDRQVGQWSIKTPGSSCSNGGGRVAGVLERDGSHYVLTTIGSDPKDWNLPGPWIISGMTEHGTEVTLFGDNGPRTTSLMPTPDGFYSDDHYPQLVIAGMPGFQAASLEDVVPLRVSVRLSGLVDWCSLEPVKFDTKSDVYRFETHPLRASATLARTELFTLEVQARTVWKLGGGSLSVEDRASIEVRPKKPVPLTEYFPVIHCLRTLFCLLTSSQVVVEGVSAFFGSDELQVPLQIDGPLVPGREATGKVSKRHEMLIRLPSLKSDLKKLGTAWFRDSKMLAPVFELYGFVSHRSDVAVEVSFLTAIRACEVFHRLAVGGTDLSEESHEERLEAILASAPDEHREWLRNELNFSNELKLRSRLQSLWKMAGAEIANLLPPTKEKKVVNRTVDARNILTHYSKGRRAPSTFKLWDLRNWWLVILEACLLRHFGVDADVILAAFKSQRGFDNRYFKHG